MQHRALCRSGLLLAVSAATLLGSAAGQALGPVPVPVENPITPDKALLGKILGMTRFCSGLLNSVGFKSLNSGIGITVGAAAP